MRNRWYGVAALWVCTASTPLAAGTGEPMLKGKIDEAYSPSVNVSSSGALVGLWRGEPSGQLDVRSIRIAVPTTPRLQKLCFSASTRDGQYSARGVAQSPPNAKDALPVAGLQASRYAEQIKHYEMLDLAVGARWGTDCNLKRSAPYLTAIGMPGSSKLIAAINSSHAISVSASLAAQGGPEIVGACRQISAGSSRAFDTRCTFDLPAEATGIWTLQLKRVPRAGPRRIDDFQLLLAP